MQNTKGDSTVSLFCTNALFAPGHGLSPSRVCRRIGIACVNSSVGLQATVLLLQNGFIRDQIFSRDHLIRNYAAPDAVDKHTY